MWEWFPESQSPSGLSCELRGVTSETAFTRSARRRWLNTAMIILAPLSVAVAFGEVKNLLYERPVF